GEFPFYIFGGVSIIAIEDVIAATLKAWDVGRSGERYILAGDNITIHELFKMIADCADVEPPKIYLPNFVVHTLGKVGDCLESIGKKGPINSENAWTSTLFHWFSHEKAKKELGLNPKPARFAIENSIRWVKEQGWLQ
ncbi:MAG: dihydroflavonol 4-reductase, partial [Bdellovibrionales bacterium]|nr:dihydroflavonol 4-reductase [Bdellovibrionales bacterium]